MGGEKSPYYEQLERVLQRKCSKLHDFHCGCANILPRNLFFTLSDQGIVKQQKKFLGVKYFTYQFAKN